MKGTGRIAILGARGMLGTDLVNCCVEQGVEIRGFDLPEFNIINRKQLQEITENSSLVINCAAYTNVNQAEEEETIAMHVNGRAVGILGELAAHNDVSVLHISTDFVFDGTLDRPYIETDTPNPISAYGRSKLEGERQLTASGCRHCILRVEWTYGQAGVNFVKKILEAANTQPVLRVVDDQIGSPTATKEVAGVICQIIQQDIFPEGIYHVAADGYTSRYDMAQYLCQTTGIQVQVIPCKTTDFASPAKRPLNSRFHCEKLYSLLGRKMRPWEDPLKEYLEQI